MIGAQVSAGRTGSKLTVGGWGLVLELVLGWRVGVGCSGASVSVRYSDSMKCSTTK